MKEEHVFYNAWIRLHVYAFYWKLIPPIIFKLAVNYLLCSIIIISDYDDTGRMEGPCAEELFQFQLFTRSYLYATQYLCHHSKFLNNSSHFSRKTRATDLQKKKFQQDFIALDQISKLSSWRLSVMRRHWHWLSCKFGDSYAN